MPPEGFSEIENALKGRIDYGPMTTVLRSVYDRFEIRSPGVLPEDFINAIKTVFEKPGQV